MIYQYAYCQQLLEVTAINFFMVVVVIIVLEAQQWAWKIFHLIFLYWVASLSANKTTSCVFV